VQSGKAFSVRATRCEHTAPDEEVEGKLRQVVEPLSRAWERIDRAKTIVLKANMAMPKAKIRRIGGRRQELVDDAVLRGLLRLLRERNPGARIVAVDAMAEPPPQRKDSLNYKPILDEFAVEFADGNEPPLRDYDVPGGGIMFRRYRLHACIAEADAFISVATLKSHAFQGVTMTLKNLFGLPPLSPHGRARIYYHHIIRLSHVLPDLGMIAQPCLNVVDGLAAQSGREWGGEGRVGDVLLAGDHPVATDAVGTWLMGFDPETDWPRQPFLRDRSALKVAARHGFGTVKLSEIDLVGDVEPPVARFATEQTDSEEMVTAWRRTTCEQALTYRDRQRELVGRYPNEYVMLQEGEVIWHGPDASRMPSRRELAGARRESAIFLKLADPEEREGEHFEVYEQELAALRELVPA
jgi:uncharacterized protein (DUF362 family)